MAYSPAARARRRCTERRADGQPCRAWAVWGAVKQACRMHGGEIPEARRCTPRKGRGALCNCGAFAWVHRPGSGGRRGACRWPEQPEDRCRTRAGSRSAPSRSASRLRGLGISGRIEARRREMEWLLGRGA